MDAVNKETMDQYFSEKARKAKEREEEKSRKAEEKARKAEEKSQKAVESTKKARIDMKRKAKPDGVNSSNTRSECVLHNDGKERLCPFCLDILS